MLVSEPVGGRSRATELPCYHMYPYYLPRRRRPGTGDIATPPVRPSVRPSVCPSRLIFAL